MPALVRATVNVVPVTAVTLSASRIDPNAKRRRSGKTRPSKRPRSDVAVPLIAAFNLVCAAVQNFVSGWATAANAWVTVGAIGAAPGEADKATPGSGGFLLRSH